MNGRVASILIDLAIWTFLAWALVLAFGGRIAANRRHAATRRTQATRALTPPAQPHTVRLIPGKAYANGREVQIVLDGELVYGHSEFGQVVPEQRRSS